MDEDEEDEERKMNNYAIIKRRVRWFWKGEWNENRKNNIDNYRKRDQDWEKGGLDGRVC